MYGTFREKDGVVHPTQHQWKWVKDSTVYGGKTGQEVLSEKKEKPSEEFFKVMKEVDEKEFNDLWGLDLERL